nr:serine--tRNA ligase [Pseudonocardiales bacterium]
MIPLQRLRDDPESIREGARLKGEHAPVDEILEFDSRARRLRNEVETSRAEQRRMSSGFRGAPADDQRRVLAELKQGIQGGEAELSVLEAQIDDLLLYVPNPPHESVPQGSGEADNV